MAGKPEVNQADFVKDEYFSIQPNFLIGKNLEKEFYFFVK